MYLLYDTHKMSNILQSFYKLTGIRITVFSDDFRKIAEAPGYDSAFCKLLRANEDIERLCNESDRIACEQCRDKQVLYMYTCHAGLTEIVTPIRSGNLVIGYLMFGQVLDDRDKDEYWAKVRDRCRNYTSDMDKLYNAYSKILTFKNEQLHAAATILEACAGYLWQERTIFLKEDNLIIKIDEYINENITADLSAAALCNRFNISRSRLYRYASEYYGCGIDQVTRHIRMEKAKNLLETTNHSISEIAYKVGYSDYNYFIKVFKKNTGITPFRYRKHKTKA